MVAACGDGATTPDAAVTADAPADAPVDAPPARACDPTRPFGAPVAISELNGPLMDQGLWLSANGLTAYFDSRRPDTAASWDLYSATRPDMQSPFDTPVQMANVNDPTTDDLKPMVTADGLTLYWSAFRSGAGDIYTATRSSTSSSFGSPAIVANVNTASEEEPTWINATGTILYMSSLASGRWKLQRATRADASQAFGTPTALDELNAADSDEWGATLTEDQRTVFFYSSRAGGGDVFTATRASTSVGFGAPVAVAELNDPAALDWPTMVSPDGCAIYMVSNRAAPAQGYQGNDLYVARRPL